MIPGVPLESVQDINIIVVLGAIAIGLLGLVVGLAIAIAVVKRHKRVTNEDVMKNHAVHLRLEAEKTRLESEKTRRETEEMSREMAQIRLDTMRRPPRRPGTSS